MTQEDASRDFELAVRSLFAMGGYHVIGEQILGHKKIDLYVEEKRLGFVRRIAIECKDYSRPISQYKLNQIYSNYRPLYTDNLIDEILLITSHGLAPSAETMCRETRELSHLTYQDLESVIIDFTSYLAGLIEEYEADGLTSRYVPPVTQQGADLGQELIDWISESSATPIAILGSYGMGKTTLAKHLSWHLARRASEDRAARIPIMVPLAEISSEQSLSGLLGKVFTTRRVARNYSFDLFMRLNRRGRFVILLDGFDEMKHSLSWEAFRYNLAEINKLVAGQSKIILIGRPTAFLTDDEHQYALHGVRSYQGRTLRDLDWPDYHEIHLEPLTERQVEVFLRRYLEWRTGGEEGNLKSQEIMRLLKRGADNVSKQLLDLASRPVQLRMIAEILPQLKTNQISRLTVTTLYDIFIDQIIEREQSKLARIELGVRPRRRFARELAWWLWVEKKGTALTATEIPEELILPYCENTRQLEARRRDLVAACFLSRKVGESLYFPHRSFQEFLVAEKITKLLASDAAGIAWACRAVTEEVSDFLCGMTGVSDIEKWDTALRSFRGKMPFLLARAWLSDHRCGKWLSQRVQSASNPWYVLFLTVGLKRGVLRTVSTEISAYHLCEKLHLAPEPSYALLCWFCILVLTDANGNLAREATNSLLNRRVVITESKKALRRRAHKRQESKDAARGESVEEEIREFVSALVIDRGKGRLDLSRCYRLLGRLLARYCFLDDWISEGTIRADELALTDTLPFDTTISDSLAVVQKLLGKLSGSPRLGVGRREAISG